MHQPFQTQMSDKPTRTKKSAGGVVSKAKIYVIVDVWYGAGGERFQENLGAEAHLSIARRIAGEIAKRRGLKLVQAAKQSGEAGVAHIWIQSFPV